MCGYQIARIFTFHWLLLKDWGNSCNDASIFNAHWKWYSLQPLNLMITSTPEIRFYNVWRGTQFCKVFMQHISFLGCGANCNLKITNISYCHSWKAGPSDSPGFQAPRRLAVHNTHLFSGPRPSSRATIFLGWDIIVSSLGAPWKLILGGILGLKSGQRREARIDLDITSKRGLEV